jgi:DNA polymerase-3 subunit alpha
MAENYVSLHVHSDHSRLDAISQISDLVDKASRLGMKAIALTDHGTISGWLKLYYACQKKGIKPIFGIEAYICDDAGLISRTEKQLEDLEVKKKEFMPLFDGWDADPSEQIENLKGLKTTVRKSNHVILLAKNKTGYHNIMKLSSLAYLEGYYYKPRIDLNLLEKYHEGIIASSACLGGQIASQILKGNMEKAEEYLQRYLKIFKDDFFIELQLHPVDEQKKVNEALMGLAKKYGVKTIITQDHHYTEKEDVLLHEVVIKLKNGQKENLFQKPAEDLPSPVTMEKKAKKIGGRMGFVYKEVMEEKIKDKKQEDDSDGYFYNAREYYFKSYEELEQSWKEHHQTYMPEEVFRESLRNTIGIADSVANIKAESTEVYLPKFDSGDLSPKDFLLKLIKEGAAKKLKPKYADSDEVKKKYEARLRDEFKIICDLKFEEYFLIVWDLIDWCKKNDIMTGPGRGSVGGSLIAYCLGITNVDPLEHGLLFSRFINKTRSSAKYKLNLDGFELEKK